MTELVPAEYAQLEPEPRKRRIGFIAGVALCAVLAVIAGRIIS